MSEDCLKQYLESVRNIESSLGDAFCYRSSADFLLKEGVQFDPGGESPINGVMRYCYVNARNLVKTDRKRYVYCEGVAMGVIPVSHAWCYDRHTKLVVDPTWKDGVAYHGVPFKWSYVVEFDRTNQFLSILDDWHNEWPLLKMEDTTIWREII